MQFLKFIREIDGMSGATLLSGKSTLRLYEGEVLTKFEVDRRQIQPPCKSIDFHWMYKDCSFYAYHKYAKDPGGHQDNQYHDLQCFIEEANKVDGEGLFFVAIADGGFWNTMNGRAGTTKIENLKSLANKKSVFALTSADLRELMDMLCAGK